MDIHQHPDACRAAGNAAVWSGEWLTTCPSPDQRQREGEHSVPGASRRAGYRRDRGVLLILNLFFVALGNSQAQGGEAEPVLAGIMINLCLSLSFGSLYDKYTYG